MKIKHIIIPFLFVFFIGSNSLYAQETCPGESLTLNEWDEEPPASWTDCTGKYTRPGEYEYIGEFKNGKKHGEGKKNYAYGHTYVGGFKENNYHGQGTFTHQNGSITVGEWKEGRIRNGTKIEPPRDYLRPGYSKHSTYTDGRCCQVEFIPTKEQAAKLEVEKQEKLEREKRFQEKVKSANVDKNKCYTLLKHSQVVYLKHGQDVYLTLGRSAGPVHERKVKDIEEDINKIKALNPRIDKTTKDFLTLNYSKIGNLSSEYFSEEYGKYGHIIVACRNLIKSAEVANPFE